MSQAAHGVALISMCVSLVSQCLRNHLLVDAITAKRQLFHTTSLQTRGELMQSAGGGCYSHRVQVYARGCFKRTMRWVGSSSLVDSYFSHRRLERVYASTPA